LRVRNRETKLEQYKSYEETLNEKDDEIQRLDKELHDHKSKVEIESLKNSLNELM
jgi:hypothetical protein